LTQAKSKTMAMDGEGNKYKKRQQKLRTISTTTTIPLLQRHFSSFWCTERRK
jgi:hypothetical protein